MVETRAAVRCRRGGYLFLKSVNAEATKAPKRLGDAKVHEVISVALNDDRPERFGRACPCAAAIARGGVLVRFPPPAAYFGRRA